MPRITLARLAALIAGCLLALPLAACTEDNPEPEGLESPTSSPTRTDTSSASPDAAPTLPPDAHGTSNKAAIAFVKYAIDVLNYSGQSLDTGPLDEIRSSTCASCKSVVATLSKIRNAGGSVRGGEWIPIETIALESAEPGRQVQVLLKYDKQVVFVRAGGKPAVFEPGRALYRFTTRSVAGDLKLDDFEEVK